MDDEDTLIGGGGDDTIDSRDAVSDQVSCGRNRDSVSGDLIDVLTHDCELRDLQ